MHIFLSYSSHYRDQADDICCRLQALGHEVFFDREDLPAGTSFDDLIRQAIESADMFIFLVAPEAVEQGRYTRTELKLAQRKWPTPRWHVLPVMVADTPFDDIPAYLRSLTLLQPEGNLTAEVVMEVEDRVRAQGTTAATPETPLASGTEGGYRSLSFRFSGDPQAGFAVHVAPGEALAAPPAIALDPAQLEQALWAHATPIAGTARRGDDTGPSSRLPSGADARQIGQRLYEALFDAERGEQLRESLRRLDPQKGDGLRFVIDTTDAPALARLPWEFIYSPQDDDFLFADRLKPVVRWLEVDAPPPTLAVAPPLRMLMAVAAPADRPELAVSAEMAQLDRALDELAAAGQLDTIRLEHTSLERLDAAMLEHQPHVLHFIGHGDFVGDDGVLLLESDRGDGQAESIAGRQLAVLLRNYRSHLRLVFLNSCMGATSAHGDPFSGVAQSLIRRGIPAVIAMQFPIPDAAAIALAGHFYRYLAAGQAVDAALSSARAFLFARGYPVEWGAPALYMRAPDGRLFDLQAPAPGAAPASAPSAPSAMAPQGAPGVSPPLARGRRGLWVGVVLLAIAGLGVAAWMYQRSAIPDDTAGQQPPPPIVAPPPDPVPEPPSVPVTEPTPDQAIDAVIARLREDDLPAARQALIDMLESEDPRYLTPLSSTRLNDMLEALDQAAARAEDSGRMADADALRALQSRLIPETAAVVPDRPSLPARLADTLNQGQFDAALSELEALPEADIAPWRDALNAPEITGLLDALVRAGTAASERDDQAGVARIITQLERIAPDIPWRPVLAPADSIAPAAGAEAPRALYQVRRGDTLWSLARRFVGNAYAWPELYRRHNQQVEIGRGGDFIADPDRLEIGMRLHLPMTIDAVGRATLQYHVVRGDTLSGIARRMYGDATLWPFLARANADAISHPDRLFVGQTLTVPPRPGHD